MLIEGGEKVKEAGISNPAVMQIRKLLALSGGNPERLCVLDGYWALEKAANAGMRIRSFLICPPLVVSDDAKALAARYMRLTDERYSVSEKTFEKLSERDAPCGMMAVAEFPAFTPDSLRGARVLAVLDGLETPGNFGTILRTCDGAGVDGVLVVNRHVRVAHPKMIKASMGAAFTVPAVDFDSVAECRKWLSDNGFSVYLADTRAENDYYRSEYRYPAALVVGCERYGISREWYDGSENLIKIPMRGISDSLNAGVAASILLYDMTNKL